MSRTAFTTFAAFSIAFGLAFAAPAAHADALDTIMSAKVINVAVPQDFAPFGSAGPICSPSAMTSTWAT